MATVAVAYLTARRWGFGPDRALIAAAIVALDPVAIVQGRAVMTETLAAFLVSLCLAATTVPGLVGYGLSGLAFGLSVLCRPSLMPGRGSARWRSSWPGPAAGGVARSARRCSVVV